MQDDLVHILVVDDDERLRDLLNRFLSGNGYRVTTAANAAEATAKMRGLLFDLLVLDIMMPGQTGLEFTRALRSNTEIPILLLTAMGESADRIEGLKAGADDYLPKPFEPDELLLRIQAILKRANTMPAEPVIAEDTPCVIGDMTFDDKRGELTRGDEIIRLTRGEADLLAIFCDRPGETISRDILMEETGAGTDRAVDVQVTRLRRKLEDDPKAPRFLQTVRGIGYILYPD